MDAKRLNKRRRSDQRQKYPANSQCCSDKSIMIGISTFDSICTSKNEKFCSKAVVPKERIRETKHDHPKKTSVSVTPKKKTSGREVTGPLLPNLKSDVAFSPPVKVLRGRGCFDCNKKMAELLSRLPDYEEFQSEIARLIYVQQRETKKSPKKGSSDNGNSFHLSELPESCAFLRTPKA